LPVAQQVKVAYNKTFFDEVADGTRESAQVIVPLVTELLKPASVLDVGCATGTWLAEWSASGVSDVLGIDGEYVDRNALQIPVDRFEPVDLQHSFSLGRTFDLVQTLEVAEHLDESCADAFVESLARHGDVILFSAAIPGQGGTHHVNEQWPTYWAEKFAKAGYTAYDVVRPRIWDDSRVQFWYRQNMLIFARGRVFDDVLRHRLDLVHPEMWHSGPSYAQVLRGMPETVSKMVRRKLGNRRLTG
jgi:SAM-dependent methyltransferase